MPEAMTETPETTSPRVVPLEWIRLCDYLENHIADYPVAMPLHILRSIPVEYDDRWEDRELVLYPASTMMQTHLEKIRPLLQKTAEQCFDFKKDGEIIIRVAELVKADDAVHHPSHYTKGNVECIEAIRASMTVAAYRGYLKGNALKYLWRYEEKGGVESLEKAQVYLGWLIENIKKGGA